MIKRIVEPHVQIFTIGHSTRSIDEFIQLLRAHKIKQVIDVRTIPHSSHNPQFNADTLQSNLLKVGIEFTHLPKLGGLRRPRKDSINTGWRNASFRGFADYMETPEFTAGLNRLIELGRHVSTAIMCAEAVPWRCHRSLIADALTVSNIYVTHIMSATQSQQHVLTSFARVSDAKITYPSHENDQPDLFDT